ncbi:inositol-trisphosphate 3-kinase homolog isoform X1 [Mytilus trossulus]|uniref:inositol-trisphosphate 3-kinase homolog isoform X1 n=2 Tax=Mytilus trossulus TaxID=6551 RepID=UPI003005FD72
MGCFHSQDGIPESDSNVETLYLARRVRSKKIQNSAAKASGSQFNDITADVSKDKTFQSKNLAAEVNNSSKDVQGKAYSIFPKWKGYKMCNACEDTESKTVNKGFKHRGHCNRCSMVKEMKNNLRKNSPQSMNITAFANLLALTTLDLTAPASDALVKNRKNTWIQLAGHPGSFAPAGPNTIWKKRITKDNTETKAYEALMADEAHSIIPIFYREVEYNGDFFIEMEDLLQHFDNPNIMDIKIGTRTFLESEVKNPVLRKDLYEKMIDLDPDAPTEDERDQQAITKLRYMQFREQESSTAAFGFRIEALRVAGEPPETNLKKIKTKDQVQQIFKKFLKGKSTVRCNLCERLRTIRQTFEISKFFMSREMIGSSVLVIFDGNNASGAWLIDFTKTMLMTDITLTHREPWTLGNHEDGYLFGLDNLIQFFDNPDIDEVPGSQPSSSNQEVPVEDGT